jgi:glutamate/tyrosine decarboxylase-like PLP-dependent enzyme
LGSSFEEFGWQRGAVMAELEAMRAGDADWRGGRVPLYVFSAPPDVQEVGSQAFNMFSSENAFGARRAFPSLLRMEQEVVGMGLDLFHAPKGAVGNMTSGGTESIVMAVKACRDWSRTRRAERWFRGNIVAPETVHPAFDKVAALMDLAVKRVRAGGDYRADVAAMAGAIDTDTIILVGSAPGFSFGVIDPMPDLSRLALEHDLWLRRARAQGVAQADLQRRRPTKREMLRVRLFGGWSIFGPFKDRVGRTDCRNP